jgi:hypothetical protein
MPARIHTVVITQRALEIPRIKCAAATLAPLGSAAKKLAAEPHGRNCIVRPTRSCVDRDHVVWRASAMGGELGAVCVLEGTALRT